MNGPDPCGVGAGPPSNRSIMLKSKLKPALVIVAMIVLLLSGSRVHEPLQAWLRSLLRWVDGLGHWGPLMFILIYIVGCLLFLPASLLTLGAGILFGALRGSMFAWTGATLGATAAFLVGRYVARDWAAGKIAANPGFAAVDQAAASEGWKIVGLIRLSPIFPFSVMNYACGITRVSLRDYVFASAAGMLPGTIFYAYLGSVIGDLENLRSVNRQKSPVEWVLYSIGLLATIAVAIYVARIARKALAQRIRV